MSLFKKIIELNKNNYNFNLKTKILKYILLFFICSFIGWLYEELLFIFPNFIIVKRGFLYGPYLPIYGWGSLLMVTLLKRFKKSPEKFFLLAVFIAGTLEYSTGKIMNLIWHRDWWNYSGYLLNIDGYVCLASAITFGLCGLLLIYLIEPLIDKMINKTKYTILRNYLIILIIIYIIDNIFSFNLMIN